MRKAILVFWLVFISGPVISAPELKGSPQDLRGFLHPKDKVVSIHGQAEEKAYSDTAIVSLVITTESKSLSASIANNGKVRREISESLIKSKFDENFIKSSKFSSSPQYGWFGKKPSSYKVINRMAITITHEEQLREIALLSDRYEEVELSDTEFEHSEKEEYNNKVRAKALQNVLEQKAFYETSLGIKLTPIGIRDSNVNHRATRGAGVIEEVIVEAEWADSNSYSSESKRRGKSRAPSFDEVRYEANLSVDFKIDG